MRRPAIIGFVIWALATGWLLFCNVVVLLTAVLMDITT